MPVTGETAPAFIDPAIVTVLRYSEDAPEFGESDVQEEPPVQFRAAVVSIAEPLMQLRATARVEPGSALKIATRDALWLGEAENCDAAGDACLIRVRLRHVLRDFETLERLAERFGAAAPVGVSVRA